MKAFTGILIAATLLTSCDVAYVDNSSKALAQRAEHQKMIDRVGVNTAIALESKSKADAKESHRQWVASGSPDWSPYFVGSGKPRPTPTPDNRSELQIQHDEIMDKLDEIENNMPPEPEDNEAPVPADEQ